MSCRSISVTQVCSCVQLSWSQNQNKNCVFEVSWFPLSSPVILFLTINNRISLTIEIPNHQKQLFWVCKGLQFKRSLMLLTRPQGWHEGNPTMWPQKHFVIKQIHLAIWTNALYHLNKYILQFKHSIMLRTRPQGWHEGNPTMPHPEIQRIRKHIRWIIIGQISWKLRLH